MPWADTDAEIVPEVVDVALVQASRRVNEVPVLPMAAAVVATVVVEEPWNIYRVVHPTSLEAQMETRVFPLKYLRPPSPYTPKIKTEYATEPPQQQARSGGAGGAQDVEKTFTLIKSLRGALSSAGKLAQDYPEALQAFITQKKASFPVSFA